MLARAISSGMAMEVPMLAPAMTALMLREMRLSSVRGQLHLPVLAARELTVIIMAFY